MSEPTQPNVIYAPWDDKTVRLLNRFQQLPFVHPFTCGDTRHDRSPRLIAMRDGWRCTDPHDEGCEYTQNWAHASMADPDKWPHGPVPRQMQLQSGECNCSRIDCDTCRERYLTSFTKSVSYTGGQVLRNLRALATKLAQSSSWLQDLEPARQSVRWCCNGNAEDCVLCTREITDKLPYPWICPGHSPTEAAVAAVRAADPNDPSDEERDEEASEALREAAERARVLVVHPDRKLSTYEYEELLHRVAAAIEDAINTPSPDTYTASGAAIKVMQDFWMRNVPARAADEELDAEALRHHVSVEVLAKAIERTEREWICCDPPERGHDLCMTGHSLIKMLKALLTDDAEVFPPRSDVLDVIMRFVLGTSDPNARGVILTKSELRETYFKAIKRGYDRVNASAGVETIHALVDEVLHARDRELVRNRQRLILAQEAQREMADAQVEHSESVAAAHERGKLEGQLAALTASLEKVRQNVASPIEEIATHNSRFWLNGEIKRVRRLLDELSTH